MNDCTWTSFWKCIHASPYKKGESSPVLIQKEYTTNQINNQYFENNFIVEATFSAVLVKMIFMNQLDQLLDEARVRLHDAPYDAAHDLAHHLEVLRNALQLAHELKDEHIDFDALRVAAMWHDIPHETGSDKASEGTANHLKVKMQQMDFHKDFIDTVYDAVSLHSFDQEPTTIEGKILFDADKLELLNIARFNRYNKAIETGKITEEKAKSDYTWLAEAYKTLRSKLHFEASKARYDKLIANIRENSSIKSTFQKYGLSI